MRKQRRTIGPWLPIFLVVFVVLCTVIGFLIKTEKDEDAYWCQFIEERVSDGRGFTRQEIDTLYRRYHCIDDKYSMPYRSERFNSLYEKHIKPL